MDTIVDLKLAYWEIALPELADYVDVVQEADDLAGQFGLLISPETYRKIIKPRHKKIVDFVKARTDAKSVLSLLRRDPRDHPRSDRDAASTSSTRCR